MQHLTELLEKSTATHSHLCPRKVLGVRIGLAGAAALGLELPRPDKRLLVILETDGCFADGVQTVTGCSIGHRTLRVEDYGKIAATFVDVKTGKSRRVAPRMDVRQRAYAYPPEENRHYFAQLRAYQIIPDDELFAYQEVQLATPISHIVSRPGVRVNCELCGEEIINQRAVERDRLTLCRACAGAAYYQTASELLL
jgi:formylmethanofuran dehydrogenase subunit E